jgi:hypothetical protein
MPRLELVTSIDAPRDVVFAYSLDVGVHAESHLIQLRNRHLVAEAQRTQDL